MAELKRVSFEASTKDEARGVAEERLRIGRRFLRFDFNEKKSMFGFKRHYEVTATVDVDPAEYGQEILERLFRDMEIDAQITREQPSEEELHYNIETDANPVLIGRGGKTLDSIQLYLRNLLNVFVDDRLVVLVDIGGYKAERKRQLEILATKTAKEVAKTGTEARLKPMNAYERRIIHTKLADWRDVFTTSEGEKEERHLVIKPKKR